MKKSMKLVSLLISVLVMIAISFHKSSLAEEVSTMKLGVLLCLTGDCAEWGNNSLKAIQLAVEELNAKDGGVLGKKIELQVQNSKEADGGSNAVSAFKYLTLNPEVHYIIGPTWSTGGLPIVPLIAAKKDMIVTSPSLGVASFNETADNIFNTWPHDAYSTKALANYAVKQGWKKVAIFSGNDDPWVMTQGNTFEEEFKRLGGEVSIKIEVNRKTTDVKVEAAKVKASNPDAVFYSDTYNMSKVARELRAMKFQGHQLSILMDDTRVKEAQGALEETIFAQYEEANPEFQTAYQKKYAEKPGITADTAYDTVKLYAQAIKQAGSFDTNKVKEVLLKADYQGASGRIVFDAQGGVIKTPVFWFVRNGKFEKLR